MDKQSDILLHLLILLKKLKNKPVSHSSQNNLRRVQNKLIFSCVLSGFILNFLLLLQLFDWIIYFITIFRIKRGAPDGDISIFHKW